MLCIATADLGQLPIFRRDSPAAVVCAAMAVERVPCPRDERRVLDGDFLAGLDRPPGHEVEALDPGVGITRVIDRRPLLGV